MARAKKSTPPAKAQPAAQPQTGTPVPPLPPKPLGGHKATPPLKYRPDRPR